MAINYVLYSPSKQKTYAGCTENLEERLCQHNSGAVKATRPGIPWRLVFTEEQESMLLARRRERYYKSSAGRRWLRSRLGDLKDATPARPATRDEASSR